MLKCPSCDATLEQDFGMVTCSECQSVLMIDMSGQVQMGQASELDDPNQGSDQFTEDIDDATDPPDPSFTAPDDFEPIRTLENDILADSDDNNNQAENFEDTGDVFDPIESDMDDMEASEYDRDDNTKSGASQDDDQSFETSFEDPDSEEDDFLATTEEGFEDVEPMSAQPLSETFEDADSDLEAEEEEELEAFPLASEPDPNPVDITSYANSEASSLEDGEFLYDVTVSRLDSKDLKEVLKYVLIDEKLKLNHHEYLKKIRDGKVTIENLNPIKAKRIVEQLQYHTVGVTWRQKRVVMEIVEPEIDEEEEGFSENTEEDLNV